ncbi:ComEA family DNA-binding protein [Shewanella aestuarii]|uniref:Helix-hairpin-helix domain-containing protein n=1 Tax=Shewanella aestuarii TaxID=1028752 RepID=A0A6G9QI11_9GAMM|nr:helix-hairpin-helix domain-containing protein [Shewanella aestuarii]QIR14180.1 helix-hairpin-helix domain-containing protein [Shewanella aestuarii]
MKLIKLSLIAAALSILPFQAVVAADTKPKEVTKAETIKEVKKDAKAVKSNTVGQITKVNINKASASELQALKGIGEAKAKAIVDYRTKNGKFTDIKQLMEVSGIGEKLIAQNAANMSL